MARIGDQLQVKVSDKGVENGKRRVSVEIEAASDLFHLTDALSREGVLKELKAELKSLIRSGLSSYLQDSKHCLRTLKGEKKPGKTRLVKVPT